MILPSIRLFTLGDVVLQGSPGESAGYLYSGRVIVTVTVPTSVRRLEVVFQNEQESWWAASKRAGQHGGSAVAIGDVLFADSSAAWGRGSYEFFFQLVLPGHLAETMYTAQRRVAYEVRAQLVTGLGGARRSAVQAVAVKRVPYFGAAWESLSSDMVNVTAMWRGRIEMSAMGCSRVQRDDQPLRVRGVVRALEKGFRLTRVGVVLEERTRTRGHGAACTSAIAAQRFLKPRAAPLGWCGGLLVDQMAFDLELRIPKAYGKIQYDVKHGPVTVSHRLAFVVAVVDRLGRATSLRLFTPLHIMPRDADGLPSYASSFADRVLLAAS
ncbi:hypothetical protein GGI04_005524 [Coemansia thaxteri]|uniref:Arrestin-like N-terminal domain-containing protein n=1 Tax=Coemansia thaxteri TaxID=2663907 RepID=A0A9W8EFS6_9FUNG|nr:hypothetical protein GGI04_005524 [Coemansia thaxteri]KAJ1998267.1 hypothetical protein H4R26_005521 [Coemansia thaxteri]KAJ2462441.1 hypothetical protein GGI02_005462 [Coemansia sp. RSA 2322]KAJ2471640.1 hypothetical protein EV174_005927 [Coemansia sp. RSA 2320]